MFFLVAFEQIYEYLTSELEGEEKMWEGAEEGELHAAVFDFYKNLYGNSSLFTLFIFYKNNFIRTLSLKFDNI